MNNKGFTLVELLAVICILLALSSITVLGMSSILENRDTKETEEQQELAIGAAKIYFSLHETSDTCVNISTLKDEGYFANNSKTDKIIDGSISNKSEVYKYHDNKCTN